MTLPPGAARRYHRRVSNRRGNPIVHRTKLFRGQSVEEVAWDTMFRGKRCTGCSSPRPIVRIQTFVAIVDIPHDAVRDETWRAVNGQIPGQKRLGTVMTTNGRGVRTGEVFSCAACCRELERAAAKLPSYVIVVIDRMPEPDRPLVQVAGTADATPAPRPALLDAAGRELTSG